MHALLDVLTLHRMRVIAKSKVNCERSFKCYFNTPHTDSVKIYTILECLQERDTRVAGVGSNGQKLCGSVLKKTVLRRAIGCASTHTLSFFFALHHLHLH